MITAVIIEDEPNSRELLQQILKKYCPEIDVLGEAGNVRNGIALIKKCKPDLVLLDIEMPGGTAFDLLDAFENIPFKTIFVTGFDHYAIKAIKYAALDYILKPVSIEELKQGITKVSESPLPTIQNWQVLHSSLKNEEVDLEHLVLLDQKTYSIIAIKEIFYLEVMGNFVAFHLDNGQRKLASRTLNYFEEILPEDQFFRIHKSYMVRMMKVKEFSIGRGGEVLLSNGAKLPIAFRRKPRFVQKMKAFINQS